MTDPFMDNLKEAVRLQQTGGFDQADVLLNGVLEKAPQNIDALQLLAVGKFARGQAEQTLSVLERALGFYPDNFEFNVLAGHSFRALGELDQTLAYYVRAAQANPASAECHIMIGWTQRTLGRRTEAATHYRHALTLNPNLVEAHNNLGVIHHDQGELEEAVTHYRAALALQPEHVDTRRNLAAALRALRRPEEALEEYETILIFNPGHTYAALMVAQSKRELCRWQDYGATETRVKEIAAHHPGGFSPFLLFSWPIPPEQLLSAARTYASNITSAVQTLPPVPRQDTKSKLRLGYFSADFRDHVVASVIPDVLERHDKNIFEVFAYSYGPDDHDAKRARIAASTTFVDLRALSDDEAARKIRADGIDILVDLTSFTGNMRHGIPARRPAPLQINWLGYPGTSGSPAMDYLIADPFVILPEARKFYSEHILYMPGSSQPHDGTRTIAAPKTRSAYGLPEPGFVFCSFNHAQKITPEIFKVWMAILRDVPGSVLWLRADRDEVVANLRREAGTHGIGGQRLVFAERASHLADHLARYAVADLALDTFPYSSHTTANDALWLGCPLLTLTGDTFAARVAGGILTSLGLQELITTTTDAYHKTAVTLARDSGALAAVRAKTAAARNARHFDMATFTRDLEKTFETVWRHHQAGEKPQTFMVSAS